MNTGDTVIHPQWGKGTVLFDKSHCVAVRFLEHGQVNFSQEEWFAQHSPSERFRGILSKGGSGISDLEYALQSAVDSGDMTEAEALDKYNKRVHVLEIRKHRTVDLNDAFLAFEQNPKDQTISDTFSEALLRYITAIVKKHSYNDRHTYSNIEDAIQESALEVWRRIKEFDPARSSFKTWVYLVTKHNIRDLLKKYRTDHGGRQRQHEDDARSILLSEDKVPAGGLSADKQLALKELMASLNQSDRTIVQMAMDGLTQEEIASALGISQQAVSKQFVHLRRVVKSPF